MLPAAASAQERLPDPTEVTSVARQPSARQENPVWVLESTLVAADRRVAVINGRTVEVGDQVQGAKVAQIEVYGVRLRTPGGSVELTLAQADPKSAAGRRGQDE